MNPMETFGKILLFIGLFIAAVGLLLLVFSKISGGFIGRLPGDIYIEKDGFKFYFPIATGIVISIILTIILNIIFLLINKK